MVAPGGGSRRGCRELPIAIVDHDEVFRCMLAGILREDGHEVHAYGAPAVPRRVVRKAALFIVELQLPGHDGIAVVDGLHRLRPAAPAVLLTSGVFHRVEVEAARRHFLNLVSKPVEYEVLHGLIHSLAQGRAART